MVLGTQGKSTWVVRTQAQLMTQRCSGLGHCFGRCCLKSPSLLRHGLVHGCATLALRKSEWLRVCTALLVWLSMRNVPARLALTLRGAGFWRC